jgi:NADPH oxidase 2
LPPLTRMLMSGEVSGDAPRNLTVWERYDRWMVNEGSRRLLVIVFVLVHAMVFGFGFVNYDLKDNLTGARGTFGITYPIARAAALVLHFDIALILFRTWIGTLPWCPKYTDDGSCLSDTHFLGETNAPERHHTIW